jgi:arylsulfatase A
MTAPNVIFALACSLALPLSGLAGERPNIIVIMADDMGFGDVGFNENAHPDVRTPQLDRLASEGLILTDFHSNGAACTPARAAFLSGRYQQRSGLTNVLFVGNPRQKGFGFSPKEVLIPSALKAAGYVSAVFGKWHVGSDEGSHPLNQGFDEFVGNIEGHVDYISKWNRKWYDWNRGLETFAEEGYVTHLLTRYTIDFIERHRDKPFFIFLSHATPHTPHQLPDSPPMYGTDNPVVTVSPEKYYPMISEMDKGVGEIMDRLEALGLADNTLIIFTADNGQHPDAGSAGIFRGGKGDMHEGGHRVPFALRWPAAVKPGRVSDARVMLMDLMPTFIELAGLPPQSEPALDGISIAPLLRGEVSKLPDRVLFWDNGRGQAVRDGDWKLVVTRAGPRQVETELFNLAEDPSESKNLAAELPERTASLEAMLAEWMREVNQGAVQQPVYERRAGSGGAAPGQR